MATDFFQQQDIARRSTTRLVVLFALAVLAIIASIELLLAATLGYLGRHPETGAIDWTMVTDPQLLVISVVGTLVIVGAGSLYKMIQLRGGGQTIAEELGGRLLTAEVSDPVERRLLNVVEEMAIASGTPTPPVYLMDREDGINAFAAGFSPTDAVIGVTRGTATQLDRDELQGVIAHEFSHILNGDMRLNIRLMGLLHGILIIGMLGYFLLRLSFYTGGGRRSRSGKEGIPIMAIGAGLAVIGFAGTFFGNLIKAAVSRQREFLADASAVQFTRQPDGLAGALKKIGGFSAGSSIENPNAPQASHMFFGRATSGFSAMFSTHPPLAERIRRIDPSWAPQASEGAPRTTIGPAPAARPAAVGFAAGMASGPAVGQAVANIGQPSPAHIGYAARLLESLPAAVISAAHESYGARAVVYALLLDRHPATRHHQLSRLAASADRGVVEETARLSPLVQHLPPHMRLPLLDIALPALRALTATEYRLLKKNVVALVEADDQIDLFEWSLHRILLRDLDTRHGWVPRARIRRRTVASVRADCELLMSVLAHAGQRDREAGRRAFEQARLTLGLAQLRLRGPEECNLVDLDVALGHLDEASPQVKRQAIEAAAACITADRKVTAAEAELLRAIAASINCPMPPIMFE